MATPQRKKMAVKTEEEKAEDILSTGSTIKGSFYVFLFGCRKCLISGTHKFFVSSISHFSTNSDISKPLEHKIVMAFFIYLYGV